MDDYFIRISVGLFLVINHYGKIHGDNLIKLGVEDIGIEDSNQDDIDKYAESCKCTVDIEEIENNVNNLPLYLNPVTLKMIYPQPRTSYFNIKTGGSIKLYCPGTQGIYVGPNKTNMVLVQREAVIAICLSGWNFQTINFVSDLRYVMCKEEIRTTAELTDVQCGKKPANMTRQIRVGFKLEDGHFLVRYTICYDFRRSIAVYSKSIVKNYFKRPREIEISTENLRTEFAHFFSTADIFNYRYQRKIINEQFLIFNDSSWFIKKSDKRVLIKTFMVLEKDFFYKTEKKTTLYYINVLPQWYKFYTYNWLWLENVVRDYSYHKNATLAIYSGQNYEVGVEIPIYLFNKNNYNAYPLPSTVWKVIYDLDTMEGIAVLGVNDPFISQPRDFEICRDISGTVPGFAISKLSSPLHMYICNISELRILNPFLPDFFVTKTLNLLQGTEKHFTAPWNTIVHL